MLQSVNVQKELMMMVMNVNLAVNNVTLVLINQITVPNVTKSELKILQNVHVMMDGLRSMKIVKNVTTDVLNVKSLVSHVKLVPKIDG